MTRINNPVIQDGQPDRGTRAFSCPAGTPDMTDWSDESLVTTIMQKAHARDEAFSVLIKRHRPWIHRRCLFRLGIQHDAEDATQEVLLRLYTRLHQFQGRSKFRTWLNRIIDNYCSTFAVRRARYEPSDNIDELIETGVFCNSQEPGYASDETELVHQALSVLPENARQVLKLRFFGEYSLDEIAGILSLTLSAAKARLYRALELLCRLYGQLENGTCLISMRQQATRGVP